MMGRAGPDTAAKAKRMLACLLEHQASYREVAETFGLGHSTVESQVKAHIAHVWRDLGIPGVQDAPFASLALLR